MAAGAIGVATSVPHGAQMSVGARGPSGGVGPGGALDAAPSGVGVGIPTPVSTAGASSMDPMFRHGAGNDPAYHADGSVQGLFRGAGLMPAAGAAPSPNETEGTVDLYTEPGAWFARINRHLHNQELMADPQEDMILFCEAEQADPVQRRRGQDSRRYTQLNVVALNWMLAALEATNANGSTDTKLTDPRQVLERWGFDGVVATETGKTEQHYDNERGAERVFNMRLRGPEHTYNVFGPNVQVGTQLYAIVRKVDVTGKLFHVNASPTASPYSVPPMPAGRKCVAYQVSFFGDYHHDVPPMKVLQYEDEDGIPRVGAYTRLGTSGNNPPAALNIKHMDSPPSSLGQIIAQPKIKMLVSHAG